MHEASRHIATEAGWRLEALLKARRFFSVCELFHLYKARILSFIESSTAGIYHAAASTLERIDRVQAPFLRNVSVSELDALRLFKLAPLVSRRDITILGILHKVNLGIAPGQIAEFFPPMAVQDNHPQRQRLRQYLPKHNKQLFTSASFTSSDVFLRSAFGAAMCYNSLPQPVVELKSMKAFQRCLQTAVLRCGLAGCENWHRLLSVQWKRMPVRDFDRFFG